MGYLTRERILGTADLLWEDVEIPEWPDEDGSPGIVRMWEMDAGESIEFSKRTAGDGALDAIYIVIVMCARPGTTVVEGEPVTRPDERLFTMEDLDGLRRKNMRVLMKLQFAALRVNKMLPGRVLELKKTLLGEAADDSPIVLPSTLAR